jgi:bifunctional non-homologous end joining protein LigD
MDVSERDLMLLTRAARPFSGAGWAFELKWDGWRALALRGERVRLLSRNGTDLTAAFPEVAAAVANLPIGTALDAELVVLDATGRSMFDAMKSRAWRRAAASIAQGVKSSPATLIAFDVLFAAGADLRELPLEGRKERLARLVPNTPHLRAMLPVEHEGEWLFAQAQSMRLEGIVAKRLGSRYRRGRTADWLKIKTEHARTEERRRFSR